jgi:ribosome maturation factor RimP
MALKDSLLELLTPAVENAGFFLDEVQITSPGNHRTVICVVDGIKPLNMDEVTSVSRVISEILDQAPVMGEEAFTLEVTSPGVDRPLTLPRHWTKNLTRLIKITLNDGNVITARLNEFNDSHAQLVENIKGRMKNHEIAFADIKRAVVEIEFNRKDEN